MTDPVAATETFWDLKASGVLKFISDLVSAVAWPAAAAFIVSLFRQEIIERIPKLLELTLPGGLALKFNAELNRVEADLANTPPLQNAADNPPREAIDDVGAQAAAQAYEAVDEDAAPVATAEPAPSPISATAESDPRALDANPTGVIMEAWERLEQVMRLLASLALGIPGPGNVHLPSTYIIANLRNNHFMTHEEEVALLKLHELRNLAAHSSSNSVTAAEAKRFVKLAEGFRKKFTQNNMQTSITRAIRSRGITANTGEQR